ncbi:MAG: Imidazolonepropionase [Candidatus Izimaplasma bacterium HR2]|nr:MAG: Imidazolonepropionase [Candidatus Izimaplasma bacterium HR2]
MSADLVILNIGSLVTPYIVPPVKGEDMNKVKSLSNAFIAIKDGLILDFGEGEYSKYINKKTIIHDADGKLVLPGLIDSHTHLIHAGSREHEFALKMAGVPYLEILANGGGILSTVKSTRESSKKDLCNKAYYSLNEMLKLGVTTIEAKSGYGLNLETEVKQLEVAKELDTYQNIDIISTYLGAHATPLEYKGRKDEYIESVIKDLEVIKEKGLAKFVDIFCEDSVFNLEDSRRILSEAKKLGFEVKIHADEIVSLGGGGLAVELDASSADHLMAVSVEDIKKIAGSNVVANLLPSTSFYLNKDYANARLMIKEGCALAISSDYNPGSSPSENLQFSMQLGANKLKMSPSEILNAVTINAAYHLRIDKEVGSIEIGKKADLVIMDSFNLEYIMYHYGINHVKDVFKNGQLVVHNKQFI